MASSLPSTSLSPSPPRTGQRLRTKSFEPLPVCSADCAESKERPGKKDFDLGSADLGVQCAHRANALSIYDRTTAA